MFYCKMPAYICLMKMPIFKKVLLALALILLLIQLIRPDKNQSLDTASIKSGFAVNAEVDNVLKTACYDCHSNYTEYPWYSNIQPVAWWLNSHIEEGKSHLNFSTFMNYPLYRQYHKLEEIDEVLAEGEMPLKSYTLVHRNAALDQSQKDLLIEWSKNMRDSMQANFPPDSLVNPKKRKSI